MNGIRRFIIKSGFKSRAGYNGTYTVSDNDPISGEKTQMSPNMGDKSPLSPYFPTGLSYRLCFVALITCGEVLWHLSYTGES